MLQGEHFRENTLGGTLQKEYFRRNNLVSALQEERFWRRTAGGALWEEHFTRSTLGGALIYNRLLVLCPLFQFNNSPKSLPRIPQKNAHAWAEHLPSLPNRGVGALLIITTKERPCHDSDPLEANNYWIMYNGTTTNFEVES